MKKSWIIFFLFLTLILSFLLRFYKLGSIPAGLHADAASQGYNAYSILQTGRDRYGQSFPILFRSFGSYQPPLYTYLTIIPVSIFGNTAYSVHFISALSGFALVFLTFLFTYFLFDPKEGKIVLAILTTLTISIAPWAIFFSRLAVEANLGLVIFVLSIFLFLISLKKRQIFPIACLILGISTHAYYSERLIAVIFLPIFIFLFRRDLLNIKKLLFLGLCLFLITQIPHLFTLNSGAFVRRFDQVVYIGYESYTHSKEENQMLNQIINIGKNFINNYLIYYSPKNLFFDSDINLGRTMPGLSVFYNWLFIPFLLGIKFLLKNGSSAVVKVIRLLLLITLIPAVLTADFFYPLRTLDYLWVITIVISLGLYQIYTLLKQKILKISILGMLFIYSIFSFYISYFVLFKYEKAENYGYSYIKLMDKLPEYSSKNIVIDSARDPGIGVRIAYLIKYDPELLQDQLSRQMQTPYYSNIVNADEQYYINNIEVKPLSFADACKHNVMLIGDLLAVSPEHIKEHSLKLEIEVESLSKEVILKGYLTMPQEKCLNQKLGKLSIGNFPQFSIIN